MTRALVVDDSRAMRMILSKTLAESGFAVMQARTVRDDVPLTTVNYAADQELGAVPTTEDLKIDSPYNTYENPGLPPTPIEAPGDAAIEAAAHPADGDWNYYVTVNLRTGETKFAETYDEFLRYKDELRQYCETESQGAC